MLKFTLLKALRARRVNDEIQGTRKTLFVYAFVFAFAWPLVAGDDIMSSGELVFEMTAEKDGICCAWARISNNL